MSTIATLAAEARSALAGSFNGTLTGPDDAGYDEARSVYNAMIDRRPGLVARCTSAADVAAVIGFARSQNALIAVRGGGHNGGGLGVCDEGVVIDLAGINSIDVDASARTVRVGGGCLWKDVDAATHEVGGAVPCGIIGTTGVGGLTLGGGIGHIARSGGLSRSTTCSRQRSFWPTARSCAPRPTRTRSCSGRSAAAAATSAWSRRSRSRCSR